MVLGRASGGGRVMDEPKWPGTVVRATFGGGMPDLFVRVCSDWMNDYEGYGCDWYQLENVELLRTGYRGE